MAKYTGNYSDFVDSEINRLSKEEKPNKEAISKLKELKKGKRFAKNKKQ